jgi:hypothetical protein
MPHLEIHPLGWLLITSALVLSGIGLTAWALCRASRDKGYFFFEEN